MSGKWHVEADATKAFKTTGSVKGGMPKDHPAGYNRPLAEDDMDWYPNKSEVIGYEHRAKEEKGRHGIVSSAVSGRVVSTG